MQSNDNEKSHHSQELPAEIYLPLVDSLYDDARSLFVGSIASSSAVLLSAWKSGESSLLFCAIAMIMVGAARLMTMGAYARRRPTTVEEARVWEGRYVFGSAAYVSLLGVWCVIAFSLTTDPFVHQISLVVTVAHLIGIANLVD